VGTIVTGRSGRRIGWGAAGGGVARAARLIWIDAREALVVRWRDNTATIERLRSDVPGHRRSTGHVRRDPAVRHGGGASQMADEPRRLEHLARFLERVAGRLPAGSDVLVLGPGTVHERLAQMIRTLDRRHRNVRAVTSEAAAQLTRRQLVARLRHAMGDEPRRRTLGADRRGRPFRGAAGPRSAREAGAGGRLDAADPNGVIRKSSRAQKEVPVRAR